MSQSNANKWMHLLHTVLNQAGADQDLLPARTADEVAVLLAKPKTAVPSPSPLCGMMVLSGPSSVRKILRSKKNTTGARRNVTRSQTSS